MIEQTLDKRMYSWKDKRIGRLNKELTKFRISCYDMPLDETRYFDEYQSILSSSAKSEEEYLNNKENKIEFRHN